MPKYVALREGIEVLGHSILAVTHAMGKYAVLMENMLARQGIRGVRPDGWYPQQGFLNAFRAVEFEIGENTLFAMGKKIPDYAELPPQVVSIEGGLSMIDAAYHLHHRDAEGPLFSMETGAMREGIGHYAFRRDGPRAGVMVCDTPYPSDFDRGIIVGLARRFRPMANAVLDESRETRKLGGDSCTYLLTW
jgi:hypothetical protein